MLWPVKRATFLISFSGLQQHGGRAPTGSRGHVRPLPRPAEQALLQLGRTTMWASSDLLQHSSSQRGDQKALVTPLVTEVGDRVSQKQPGP